MPSIELIAIKQASPITFEDLPFAVESETQLKSHKDPSIFQTDFDSLSGCIYHLGGITKKGGSLNALELLSDECINQEKSKFIEFKKDIFLCIQKIMNSLLESSPASAVFFTSDYHKSENTIQRFENIPVKKFCELHDKKEILFNASYKIIK